MTTSAKPLRFSSRLAMTRHLLATQALWALLGLAAGLLGSVSLPMLSGHRSFTVMSGSMEPTLHTGDVIVTRPISPLAVHIGDVVTFADPADSGRLVTHRVRSLEVRGADAFFETKGDANNTVERWTVPTHGRIGRVAYRVPRLGYPMRWVSAPSRRRILAMLPMLGLGAAALLRIWRPRGHRYGPHERGGNASSLVP